MDSILKNCEVMDQCTLSPFTFPELTEICDEKLSNSYENYQESVFRSLSANFDNNTNINTVNQAYENLEKCFIENNVLTKHGTSKFKASASTKLLSTYRDIEDAFADLFFPENAGKRLDSSEIVKKIDLKRFKDNIFPIKLYDFPLSDVEDSQSNSEEIEDSESFLESFLSENEVWEHDETDTEAVVSKNVIKSELDFSIPSTRLGDKSEDELIVQTDQTTNSIEPIKNAVKDIRIVVEKLPDDISDESVNDEDENSCINLSESDKSLEKEIRQVARKRTGGAVSNNASDVNCNIKEQKIIQQLSSKDGDFVPSVFDKMTRAGKRDLERVLAESTANLVIQKTSQLITEKIKELRPSDNQSESGSSEDEDAQGDIHKTAEIVTNTIIEFLTKSKCKKLEKLGKDISDEISNKLNCLRFGTESGNNVLESNAGQAETCSETNVEKIENKSVNLSGDTAEISNSTKRATRETTRKKSVNNLLNFEERTKKEHEKQEMIINSTVSVENDFTVNEPRRPETRQSKQKKEGPKNVTEKETCREEPRRPETRQLKQKLDGEAKNISEKELGHDDHKRLTRFSVKKQDVGKIVLEIDSEQDKPRRPETRQSKQKPQELKHVPLRDSSSDESNRRETRLSKLKKEDDKSRRFEQMMPKDLLKPVITSKQKTASRPKRRKVGNKLTDISISDEDLDDEPVRIEQLIDGEFLMDAELSEESSFCISNSSLNKALNDPADFHLNSLPISDCSILKASADSTTFDTNLIIEETKINDNNSIDSEKSNAVTATDYIPIDSNRDCTECWESLERSRLEDRNKEEFLCHSSQDESTSQHSLAFDNLKEAEGCRQSIDQIDETVDDSNGINKDLSSTSQNPDQLVVNPENVTLIATSTKYNLNEDNTLKHEVNELKSKNENLETKESHSVLVQTCVPSQVLNDIITNIEQEFEGSFNISAYQRVRGDMSDENTETVADSTSFLDYTLDDSFKLVVDECIPKKEENDIAQGQCNGSSGELKPNSDLPKPNDESKLEVDTDQSCTENSLIKEPVQEKPAEKDLEKENHFNEESDKNEKHSSPNRENSVASTMKPLTNEEKIARITNRDPRLVNDKKIVNVLIRDPRLRNKLPKCEESQEKPVEIKHPQVLIEDTPQSPEDNPQNSAPVKCHTKEKISEEDKTLPNCEGKTTDVLESEATRKKKAKKEIDEELLYKTPLSDLHASTSEERPTYIRNIKSKRQGHPSRKDKDQIEDSAPVGRYRAFDESNEENSGIYKEPLLQEDNPHARYYNQRLNFNERHFRPTYNEEINHRLEEKDYAEICEERRRDFQPLRQDYQSGSAQSFESVEYARRTISNSERRDITDNQFYSRREFYRRNKYSHDHDHFSNANRFVEVREEIGICSRNEPLDDSIFNSSAYPPVSMLPDPMYSQEEDFDQNFTNMETDSFSPPSSDLCPPPPPLIRPPSPNRLRRENFCPSPPRIGRASPDRDYEPYNRPFPRNFERDERSSRGRNNFPKENSNLRLYRGGSYRRGGNGRDYRTNEESPPRKRFVTEHFGNREDDRGWRRRSPSWSPDRSRRWSSDRSLSPQEPSTWDRSPPEPRPWDSPPPAEPPRRADHYRERSQAYKNYRW